MRAGGGTNHRLGLYDQVLIKDNHVRLAGGVRKAVESARREAPGLTIEVEAQSLAEAAEAAEAGADIVLLDNLTTAEIREAVGLIGRTRTNGDFRRRHARADPGAGRNRRRLRYQWVR